MQSTQANKIMIVDDDDCTRSLYHRMLTKVGFTVIEAGCGEDALLIADHEQLNGILMDIHMPGINGIETCRRLRKMEQHRATPILFLTANDKTEILKEAFSAGGDDFIQKPINPVILHARLQGHIQRAHYYHELENLRKNLNRYISTRTQEMVERYTKTGILPPPEQQDVCIMFTDIRDFTSLSQKTDAEEMFTILGQHLGEQVDLVYQHNGYVDKFGGDGIMAVFEGEDKSERACHCALDIIEMTRQHWESKHEIQFKPGIGVYNGEAILGNIGSSEHLDYSVVGNTVNLAARLCGHAKAMSIVTATSVRDDISNMHDLHFTNEHDVKIKGINNPVSILNLSRGLKGY